MQFRDAAVGRRPSRTLLKGTSIPCAPIQYAFTGACDRRDGQPALSDPAFFLMIDVHPLLFLACATLRSIIGYRTVGILFRTAECLRRDKAKYRLKFLLFRYLTWLHNVSVLTILPFYLDPRFAEIASNWIPDPQLWDLAVLPLSAATTEATIVPYLKNVAAGRRIIVALGSQDTEKGFEYFVDIWNGSAAMRQKFLFVAAGRVAAASKPAAAALERLGAVVLDRRIEDGELLQLYKCADAVWSCYSPNRNLSSGIFGRAYQFGCPAIVRAGSFIERVAQELEYDVLSVPFGSPGNAAILIENWRPRANRPSRRTLMAMRARTLMVLQNALID
jgi:hypothetical protein